MQAGASKVTDKHIDMTVILKKILSASKFKGIYRKDVMIPSFGEENAFLFGRK
jgi:hypothetical protein